MKQETRSQVHAAAEDEGKVGTRKHKTENKEADNKGKKPKATNNDNGHGDGKPASEAADFEDFCKFTKEYLSVDDMRKILEANDQEYLASDDTVVSRCQDIMYYGPFGECPVCNSKSGFEYTGREYKCISFYSEWSTCTYTTRDPPRKEVALKLPNGIKDPKIVEWFEKQDLDNRPKRPLPPPDQPFLGVTISLSGRLSRTHQYWKREIEKHGGKVSNTVPGVTCLVVSPAERERGDSFKVVEAMEREIPVVREAWLTDSIEKQAPQPIEAYDVLSDLAPEGRGIPWDKMDPSEEALESLPAELKMYGKRSVHKDSMLREQGGVIFEKDGILFNCALSVCDKLRNINEYCIMQLIMVPENRLHLYFKKGRVGDDPGAEERVEERTGVDETIEEFAKIFEGLTGNKFEPWEREKEFKKNPLKFYPIDIDDGYDVRYGGLGLRQLGVAAAHCKLDSLVAKFMKTLCGQEIYRYALMEMAMDSPELPMGMLSEVHLRRCEEALVDFHEKIKSVTDGGPKVEAMWAEFSNKWFTVMHSTRPFIFRDFHELADNAAAGFETTRDINTASRLIGDMSGSTIDDPLSDRYEKLGCAIKALEKDSDDYKMILNYLEKTYEPFKVGDVSYGASVENIFEVEPIACPSLEDVQKLPNKILLWCGTRSSNLLRHLHKGFLPAVCSIPAPGYMFGRAIVCSDAAAEAARYGFTAVDRPEGFLVLAVASLGDEITEVSAPPEDTRSLEEKKMGVKGLGRKTTDESEHLVWKDDIKVPCGRLVESEHRDSLLEYNEFAVYDPKQVSIRFLVGVKYEEQNGEMNTEE
ncbi:protein ADP-ribosyltransferase PARP3 [Aristolochia californica]|uniref:protein ADP-ribosyltransferase PARP3 n=1 Tax=Aristolochia californica TaxID=171875 RepID=UPI0035E17B05